MGARASSIIRRAVLDLATTIPTKSPPPTPSSHSVPAGPPHRTKHVHRHQEPAALLGHGQRVGRHEEDLRRWRGGSRAVCVCVCGGGGCVEGAAPSESVAAKGTAATATPHACRLADSSSCHTLTVLTVCTASSAPNRMHRRLRRLVHRLPARFTALKGTYPMNQISTQKDWQGIQQA